MSTTEKLPALPGVLEAVGPELLDPPERLALETGAGDPYYWLRAVGRVLRATSVEEETRRELRQVCTSLQDWDTLRLARLAGDASLAQLDDALDRLRDEEADDAGAAWQLLVIRDDLESLAVGLSCVGRALLKVAPELAAEVRDLESGLLDGLRAADDAVAREEEAIAEALRDQPDANARSRLTAVGEDAVSGYWLAWMPHEGPSPKLAATLAALEDAIRSSTTPDPPVVWLSRTLTRLRAAPTAASDTEILTALAASRHGPPLATLDSGRVALRLCRPASDDPDETGLGGLAIIHADFAAIKEVRVELPDKGTIPVLRVEGHAYWISLADFGKASTVDVVVQTESGEHRCRVSLT